MAITTDNEKYSLVYAHLPWCIKPITALAFVQADKQQLLWEYPGILWTVPPVTGFIEEISGNSYQSNTVDGNSIQDNSNSGNSYQTASISGGSKI